MTTQNPPAPAHDPAYAAGERTVSELSAELKRSVESAFGRVRVRGEISQPKIAGSGHCYLRLKDEGAVLDAVVWRGTLQKLSLPVEEGMEVVASGRLTTYPGKSSYQLVIDGMDHAGEGALLKMLEERKRRLAAEGLFDSARKKPLPFLPRTIGVVTSPSGAVIRDILHRLADRFPMPVLLWPVLVQGAEASGQIAAAVEGFNRVPLQDESRPDVLIVARGGGSVEDLMPFNDEAVVRAVAASKIPVISAVGHETDVTLCDFAADVRAPTPTAAAEMAAPVRSALAERIADMRRRMHGAGRRLLDDGTRRLQGAARGAPPLRRFLEERTQRLDERWERAVQAVQGACQRRHAAVQFWGGRLRPSGFEREWNRSCAAVRDGFRRLEEAWRRQREGREQMLGVLSERLEASSHNAVLKRGYALLHDDGGRIVDSRAKARAGEILTIVWHDGATEARVGDTAGRPETGTEP